MPEIKKVKARLISVKYVKEAESVLYVYELDDGRKIRMQEHRNEIASFGKRTAEEIDKEMEKYVDIIKETRMGKVLNLDLIRSSSEQKLEYK